MRSVHFEVTCRQSCKLSEVLKSAHCRQKALSKNCVFWHPCGIGHPGKCSAKALQAADSNGKSDPYVCFPRQRILDESVRSKRRDRTLNPKWNKAKDFKPLTLSRTALPYLEKSLLLLQMMDFDRLSADDLIGCGVLPLANLAGARAQRSRVF